MPSTGRRPSLRRSASGSSAFERSPVWSPRRPPSRWVGRERNNSACRELCARGAKYTSGRSGSTARQPLNALKRPPSQMPMRSAAGAGLEQCSDTDAALGRRPFHSCAARQSGPAGQHDRHDAVAGQRFPQQIQAPGSHHLRPARPHERAQTCARRLVGTIVFHRKSCLCKFEQGNARLCVTFMNGRPKSGSLAVHRLPSV